MESMTYAFTQSKHESVTDGPTNRQNNRWMGGRMDGRTKRGVVATVGGFESRLKNVVKTDFM